MLFENSVKQIVAKDQVVLFMKGVPGDSPCGYSNRLFSILDHLSVPYKSVNVLLSQDIREGVKKFSGIKTLPQLFINGVYAGGSDDIRELYENDRLTGFLNSLGVDFDEENGHSKLLLTDVSKAEVMSCFQAGKQIAESAV